MTGQDYPLTQEYRFQKWDATTTLAFWTPRANVTGQNNYVVLTGLNISANTGGTFEIYNGTTNSGPQLMFQFLLGNSSTIAPVMGPITTTLRGGILYGRPSASGTNGFTVLATGYEVAD